MAIYSKPEDEHYRGPCTYRLIVNGQNYCGKTFTFHKRMICHKTKAKCWKERLERGEYVQDVSFCISDAWINVTIEIIARYPDKIKAVEADELFMCEREVEAIAFYDSYHNGLNMDEGGRVGVSKSMMGKRYALGSTRTAAQKQAMSQRMKGNQHSLGSTYHRTEAQKQAHSQLMRGHNFNADRRKSITATQDDKTWHFESSYAASTKLANEFKEKFDQGAISKACRGKYHGKHVYKGIHFIYD